MRFLQGQRLYATQPVSAPMSTSIRCLKLNVRSALDILLRQNSLDQDERLKKNPTEHFLPIIRKCLNVQVQDRYISFFDIQTTNKECFFYNRPSFTELLEELGGKPYISPIQRSLQLTLFNGITPVLDHNLDLTDFKYLDCSY
jgi:hypothetical protein